jgi:alkanesulfonate monooxygenase
MAEPMFVGSGSGRAASELLPPTGPPVQFDHLRRLAAAHEQAGFDAALVGASATSPDALVLAAEILRSAGTLATVITVRPGDTAPAAAARALATLDALHPGRVAVHLSPDSGPGTADYAEVLTRTWSGDRPFSTRGEHYAVDGAWTSIRPATPLPVWLSGADAGADGALLRYGSVRLLPTGSPLAPATPATPSAGPRLALRLRPIVASTRRAADDYADRVLRVQPGDHPTRSRALRAATGAMLGTGSLVGPPDEVAATLLGYRALGIDVFHLVGWRPLADLPGYGAVIEAVRAATAPAPSERRTA